MWALMDRKAFTEAAVLKFPELAAPFLEGDEFFTDEDRDYLSVKLWPADKTLWITGLWASRGRGLNAARDVVRWAQARKDQFSYIGFTMARNHPWIKGLTRYYEGRVLRENAQTISWIVDLDSKRLKAEV